MNKKKIIFINNHFQQSDGTVRALINLCNALDKHRYDITILPLYRLDNRIAKELEPHIHLKEGLGFYFRGLTRLMRLIPIDWLYNRLIGEKYDIEVGFQCDIPTKLVGYRRKKNILQIAWMHGYENYPQYYCNVDQVVCVSKDNADRCRKELPYKANVTFCHNLLNGHLIKQLSKAECNYPTTKGITFITVNRLSPEKGLIRLVRVFFELKKEGHSFTLLIIGDGKEKKKLQKEISKLHLGKDIFLLGQQNNPHPYTVRADVYLCSSYNEGYNTSSIEAALLGIPIISTQLAGAHEIIDQCQCGTVCANNNEALKEIIRDILIHPETITKWKNILKNTKHSFSYEEGKKRVNYLFDQFLERKSLK